MASRLGRGAHRGEAEAATSNCSRIVVRIRDHGVALPRLSWPRVREPACRVCLTSDDIYYLLPP
jgi:hypothetical protein